MGSLGIQRGMGLAEMIILLSAYEGEDGEVEG